MKYVYPVIFKEEDGKCLVEVPDLSGCFTFGDNLIDAISMARDAMAMWLCLAEDNKETIPQPSKKLTAEKGFVSYVDVDTVEYRRFNDNKAIKKTLSLPSWLNAQAELAGLNFSAILQEALKQHLQIK